MVVIVLILQGTIELSQLSPALPTCGVNPVNNIPTILPVTEMEFLLHLHITPNLSMSKNSYLILM